MMPPTGRTTCLRHDERTWGRFWEALGAALEIVHTVGSTSDQAHARSLYDEFQAAYNAETPRADLMKSAAARIFALADRLSGAG